MSAHRERISGTSIRPIHAIDFAVLANTMTTCRRNASPFDNFHAHLYSVI